MAKPKLRTVPKGEQRTLAPRQLRAKQVFSFQLAEGGEGIGMVDMEGVIYLRGVEGWIEHDMSIVEVT